MTNSYEFKEAELELRKLKTLCLEYNLKLALFYQINDKGVHKWYLTIFRRLEPVIDIEDYTLCDLFKKAKKEFDSIKSKKDVALGRSYDSGSSEIGELVD